MNLFELWLLVVYLSFLSSCFPPSYVVALHNSRLALLLAGWLGFSTISTWDRVLIGALTLLQGSVCGGRCSLGRHIAWVPSAGAPAVVTPPATSRALCRSGARASVAARRATPPLAIVTGRSGFGDWERCALWWLLRSSGHCSCVSASDIA